MTAILFTMFGVNNAVEFDCTLSESHSSSASPTEHPVEKGVAIYDHVHVAPDRVQLEGLITDTPLNTTTASIFRSVAGVSTDKYRVVAAMKGVPTAADYRYKTSRQRSLGTLSGQTPVAFHVPLVGNTNKFFGKPTFTPGEFAQDVHQKLTGHPIQFEEARNRVQEVYEVLQLLVTTGTEVVLLTDLREYPKMLITSLTAPRRPEHSMAFQMSLQEVRSVSTKETKVTVTPKNPAEPRGKDSVDGGPLTLYAPTYAEATKGQNVLESLLDQGTD